MVVTVTLKICRRSSSGKRESAAVVAVLGSSGRPGRVQQHANPRRPCHRRASKAPTMVDWEASPPTTIQQGKRQFLLSGDDLAPCKESSIARPPGEATGGLRFGVFGGRSGARRSTCRRGRIGTTGERRSPPLEAAGVRQRISKGRQQEYECQKRSVLTSPHPLHWYITSSWSRFWSSSDCHLISESGMLRYSKKRTWITGVSQSASAVLLDMHCMPTLF